jgi:3-hydroxyisobutyrate dehydrogenase-like beta-hydroxyacid dehydrogenase
VPSFQQRPSTIDARQRRRTRRTAAELAIPLPWIAVAEEMLARASELGYAHRDLAALHEVLAESLTA